MFFRFDVQLRWVNLAENKTRNFLNEKEKEMIWTPNLRMEESEFIKPIKIDESAIIYVEKITKETVHIIT